ncbi:hypothetical protein GQ42DRAFT_77549 [Ramicandelaber brevisporus]|nr:hypothetical protein GQ42DRAFT_77549 [Ramicandelaber brevisporus]
MERISRIRAQLHQLIGTAGEDDLVEIYSLLLNSGHYSRIHRSGPNCPFPLFDLPLELFEYTATFFNHLEAFQVLTVNQLFHESFARSIWCSIKISALEEYGSDTTASGGRCPRVISPKALKRYGRLVHDLVVDVENTDVSKYFELVPNLMSTVLLWEFDINMIRSGKFSALHNLREIDILLLNKDEDETIIVDNWISNNALSGHVKKIKLGFEYDDIWYPVLYRFAKHSANCRRIEISLQCRNDRELPSAKQLAIIAPLIDRFEYVDALQYFECPSVYLRGMIDYPDLSFPKLRALEVMLCCLGSNQANSNLAMDPRKFPSIKTLCVELKQDHLCSDGPSLGDSAIAYLLSHSWPNVESFVIDGWVTGGHMDTIASKLPNLVNFECRSPLLFKLDSILTKLSRLQSLTLSHKSILDTKIGICDLPYNPLELTQLKKLKLSRIKIDSRLVQFINCTCTNLIDLEISYCRLVDGVVAYTKRLIQKSPKLSSNVRRIMLYHNSDAAQDEWFEFICTFKDLRTLDSVKRYFTAAQLTKLTQKSPSVTLNF